ncbi:hypothetical protein AOQ84DRAFT_398545 [Glonium stellatum]|uniref:Uncharacterized protein n=1 Tax=Glonium stellatum TaxID=574774 RepID=A0A8E2EZP1_9PEZI|nr:hypothetical protein AOQ84DRAFT_398545 [Glonium stellatum]
MLYKITYNAERLSQIKETNNEIFLCLGPSKDSQTETSSILSAYVYASYVEGYIISRVLVSYLHINNIDKSSSMPPVGELISQPRLEDKMNECYETHNGCPHEASARLPKGFRAIDVSRRCLVEISVYTPSSLLAASRTTINEMKKEGGLPTLGMPRTIEDAIRVCIRLGERYIWAMNDIYSSAQLVLVVAYGNSMNFGVPSVSHPRKAVQHHEDFLGFRFTNVIRETYQEAVLSRRRLYVTKNRDFFECEQSMCYEDQFNMEKSRNDVTSFRPATLKDNSRFRSFVRHLEHCTSRKLTHRSDAYNAVNGILTSLYDGKTTFTIGLPRLGFDRALLWFPHVGKNSITRLEIKGVVLPTWSWSSIMSLSDQALYQSRAFYGALSPWYLKGDLCIPGSTEAVYMAIACSEGCMENIAFPSSPKTDNFSTMRKMFNTFRKNYSMLCREMILSVIKSIECLQARDNVTMHSTRPGVIIGGLCGLSTKLREEVASSGYDTSINFKFIALSLSGRDCEDYLGEGLWARNYSDIDGNSLAEVPVVSVLMIGREGSFAHRRELDWVYLMDWVKLCREWKRVMLE